MKSHYTEERKKKKKKEFLLILPSDTRLRKQSVAKECNSERKAEREGLCVCVCVSVATAVSMGNQRRTLHRSEHKALNAILEELF